MIACFRAAFYSLSLSVLLCCVDNENIVGVNLLRSKTGLTRFYSGVNLAIFTPQAMPSYIRTPPINKKKPYRVLLGVSFASADCTSAPKSYVSYMTEAVREKKRKKKREVKTLAKRGALG